MIHSILDLNVDYAAGGATPPEKPARLFTYVLDDIRELHFHTRPAIIICPGGGYSGTCDREAEPIAVRFNALGCHAFVLRYNCRPARYPVALLEIATAVAEVRAHADEWHVDPDRILVLGFSAGGHLAASLGNVLESGSGESSALVCRYGQTQRDDPVLPRDLVGQIRQPGVV